MMDVSAKYTWQAFRFGILLEPNPNRATRNKVISQRENFTGDHASFACGRAKAGLGATNVVQGCYGT
ncbi:hypothetical protein [Bradyrhizobium sp. LMG 9283]|uniref:hypothetical protein n=1 Tax=Bradyrhizobium sp. LMG 9283 TaxID=592064 RepID=UPI00388E5B24